MRFTAPRDDLARAFAALGCVVMAKNVIPVLGMIKIEATQGVVILATHNLDQCVSATVAADVSEEGAACIPFDPLYGIVTGSAKGSHVSIDVGDKAKIAIGRSRYSLGILPPADFPPMLQPIDPSTLAVLSTELVSLIESTSYAVNSDNPKPHETTIFMHEREVEGSPLRQLGALATKGASVAMAWLAEPLELHLPLWDGSRADDGKLPGFFLSREVAGHIRKIAKDGTLKIAIGSNAISVETGNVIYAAKLIERRAVNYRLIPPAPSTNAKIDREAILAALGRLRSVLPDGLSRAVKVSWTDGGTFKIALGGDQTGEEELDGLMTGNKEFACNILFLQEVIDHMPGDEVRLCADNPFDPVHVFAPSDPCRHAIIMPMRTT